MSLWEQLSDADPARRQEAARILYEREVAARTAALDDRSRHPREVAEALRELGRDGVPALCEGLSGTLPDVPRRRACARALEELGDQAADAAPNLKQALTDPDAEVCLCSARALIELEPFPEIADRLRELLDEHRGPASVALYRLFRRLCAVPPSDPDAWESTVERAATALARLVGTRSPDIAADALAVLGQPPSLWVERAVTALGAVLHAADVGVEVRLAAARALGRIASPAIAAADALIDALTDPEVRLAAATALRSVLRGLPASEPAAAKARERITVESVPWLREQLEQVAETDRTSAAEALGALGKPAAPAVPALVEALDDGDPEVRLSAVRSLAWMGPPAAAAVPALRRFLEDATEPPATLAEIDARHGAVTALGSSGSGDAVAFLVAALDDDCDDFTYATAVALAALAQRSVPALRDALSHPSPRIRGGAAAALGYAARNEADRARAREAVPELVRALDDPSVEVRVQAVDALGKMGPGAAAAVAPLLEKLDENLQLPWYEPWEDPPLVPDTLARIGRAAVAPLVETIERSEVPERRFGAVKALRLMGAAATDALPSLLDPDLHAAWDLAEIGFHDPPRLAQVLATTEGSLYRGVLERFFDEESIAFPGPWPELDELDPRARVIVAGLQVRGPHDEAVAALLAGSWPRRADLDELEMRGISILVNLTDKPYDDPRFEIYDLPVGDYMAPELEQIDELCRLVEIAERRELAVYVHCVAGCGRTGTMMACVMVYRERLSAEAAIRRVRDLRECSIESDAQEEVVGLWREHLEDNGYRLFE